MRRENWGESESLVRRAQGVLDLLVVAVVRARAEGDQRLFLRVVVRRV